MIIVGGALGGRKIAKDLRDFAVLCYEPIDATKKGACSGRACWETCASWRSATWSTACGSRR